MDTSRREFLKISSLTGIGLASTGVLSAPNLAAANTTDRFRTQRFNMCGYAAPKIPSVRIGFIGLGNRGPDAVQRMTHVEGTEVKGLCDIRPEKANAVKKQLEGSIHKPDVYTGNANEWKKMCERADIDLIYIATPWELHAPMADIEYGSSRFIWRTRSR